MSEADKSRVDQLSDKLYSRTRYSDPSDARSVVKNVEPTSVENNWQGSSLDDMLSHERQLPETKPFMKKFFIFAVLFFIATLFVAGFVFLGGANFISSKNVDIKVVGPTTASAGGVLELGVTITNKNNTDLELANFYVQYPDGSRDPVDSGKSINFTKEELGVVKAGAEVARNTRFVLIGSAGEVKEIKYSMEYKVKGSNATFYKDKVYEITIGDAPLGISVESLPSVTSGDTFTTSVTLTLNSTDVLKNVMLRGEYPYGYSVVSTDPAAVSEKNVWALGDFSPGTKKTIQIKGKLVGENQEERTFRFYGGVAENGSTNPDFKTVIISAQNTVKIARPAINLNIAFNGESGSVYVAPAARPISVTVRFQNNLPEKIINPHLEISLNGAMLDRSSVQTQNAGFYDSGRNTIVWNLANNAGSPEILPGEGGTVTFSFNSLATGSAGSGKDINLGMTLSASPVSGGNPLTVTESRIVRISSQVSLSSKALHSTGPYTNQGPIPPRAENMTTYTVVLDVGNTQNDVKNAKVTAKLGPGVKWLASQSATSESVNYDSAANTMTWNLGDLTSGSGFSTAGREVAIQISLTPSVTQVGTAPVLVSGITFSGTDALGGNAVTVTNPVINTKLSSDPAFIQGDDIVLKK